VSLAEGATNGTLHLTVNGNAQTDIAVPGWSSKADASALNSYALTSSLGFGTAGTDYVPITLNSVTKNVLTAHQSLAGYLPLTGGTMTGTLNSAVYHPIVLRPSSGASFIQWLTSNSVNAFEVGVSFGGTYPIWLVWDATAAVSALTIKNGKVGIKTDAPAYDLDVNGSIKADAITLTATTSPNLTLNNVGASESSVYARFQMDSVTKAEFGYYNSSAYFGSNSAHKWLRIYDTGAFEYDGNTIYHSGNSNKSDVAWNCSTITANYIFFRNLAGTGNAGYAGRGSYLSNDIYMVNYGANAIRFYTNDSERLNISSGGNVGIGTASPSYKLDVVGNARIRPTNQYGVLIGNIGNSIDAINDVGGWANLHLNYSSTGNTSLCYGGGNVGIGTDSPSNKLHVIGTSDWAGVFQGTNSRIVLAHSDGYGIRVGSTLNSSSHYLMNLSYNETTLGSGGSSAFYVRADGRVGIGTSSPGYTLDVNGTVSAPGFRSGAICIETNADGTITGRGQEINNYTGPIFLQYNTGNNLILCMGSGNVGIGTTVAAYKLHVAGLIASSGDQVITSDATKKENFEPIVLSAKDISKVFVGTFDWKDGRGKSFGTIAQDWTKLMPSAVLGKEGDYTFAYAQAGVVIGVNNATEIYALQTHETEQDKEIRKLRKALGRANQEILRLQSEINNLRMNYGLE